MTFCGGGGKGGSPTQPVPIATPTPTPTPAPTYQPLSASCARLPLGSAKYRCDGSGSSFMSEVNDAIDTVRAQHPEYFNAAGDRIVNVGAYYVSIIRLLDKQNLCATFDGEELLVKNSPDFSDQYKIQTSWNAIGRKYTATCYPAVFPLSRDNPSPSPAGCALAPSQEITCGVIPSEYLGDVQQAVADVVEQRPELFDLTSHARNHDDWYKVKDLAAYQTAVIDLLSKKGYCGKSGEEIEVKRSNDFTEHFDINYQDQYLRNGSGIYRSTCYPAAF
ncbi:MAG TPA: hypothetical protein VMX54_10840 [Vicinamibacteria bacterium]|nr:hypothetical protein [Vicinamibacteria bacterium]